MLPLVLAFLASHAMAMFSSPHSRVRVFSYLNHNDVNIHWISGSKETICLKFNDISWTRPQHETFRVFLYPRYPSLSPFSPFQLHDVQINRIEASDESLLASACRKHLGEDRSDLFKVSFQVPYLNFADVKIVLKPQKGFFRLNRELAIVKAVETDFGKRLVMVDKESRRIEVQNKNKATKQEESKNHQFDKEKETNLIDLKDAVEDNIKNSFNAYWYGFHDLVDQIAQPPEHYPKRQEFSDQPSEHSPKRHEFSDQSPEHSPKRQEFSDQPSEHSPKLKEFNNHYHDSGVARKLEIYYKFLNDENVIRQELQRARQRRELDRLFGDGPSEDDIRKIEELERLLGERSSESVPPKLEDPSPHNEKNFNEPWSYYPRTRMDKLFDQKQGFRVVDESQRNQQDNYAQDDPMQYNNDGRGMQAFIKTTNYMSIKQNHQ